MKGITLLLSLLISGLFFSQKTVKIDSLQLADVQEILGDDYGNVYVYKKKNFSLCKYDSLGHQVARLMMINPYKIQGISNPLNIVMFSENAQELKFLDQNLNEIQKINLSSSFNFVKAVYAEDLQYAWVLDDSNKTLVQYNFRTNTIINSFPFNINLESLKDFLVYNNKIYILRSQNFEVYNTRSSLIFSASITNAQKLKRNDNSILIFGNQSVYRFDNKAIVSIFSHPDAKIVDKNRTGFLALIKNKLYLYAQ